MSSNMLYNVRPITDLKDMMEQSAEIHGDKAAFLIKTAGGKYESVSYSDFKNDIDFLGTALISLGLKDCYIAVIGENRYEWCVTYLAAVNGTGIVVPLDKELPSTELENLLSRSNTSAVVFSGKFTGEMKRIAASLHSLKYYINMDADEDQQNVLSFKQLVKKGRELIKSGDRSFLDAQINPEEMKILLFTSGTTDLAKGVMLSHKNICSNITAVCSTVHIDSSDSSLSILPLHHTYECSLGFLAVIYNGSTISFCEGLKYIAKNLKEVKPSLLFTVPLLLESMYKKIWDQARKRTLGNFKLKAALFVSGNLYRIFGIDIRRKLFKAVHDNLGGRMRLVVTGAAAIEPSVSEGFRAMGILVLQGYGLTECSPLVTGNRDFIYKDSSIGLPLPGVEVKIDNPDEEGIGELVCRGPNVMLGYYKNEEATRKVLADGWFHTGDLGYVDKSGFYYITGREKNVIITKNGKNIYPEEVESYINKSLYIEESLVWGEYDQSTGETSVKAQILPNFTLIKEKLKVADLSREEIMKVIKEEINKINHSMPLYKRIKEFNIREHEFIKTTTKKIKRYLETEVKAKANKK